MIYVMHTWPTIYCGGGGQGVGAWENRGWEAGEERAGKGRKWERKGREAGVLRKWKSFINH